MRKVAILSILAVVIIAAVVVSPATARKNSWSTVSLNAYGCANTGNVTFTLTTSGRVFNKTVTGGCPAHFQHTMNFAPGVYRFKASQCVNHDYYWSPWRSFYIYTTDGGFYTGNSDMIVEPNFC